MEVTRIKLFNMPVSEIKGVGHNTEKLLQKLRVTSVGSLLTLFPIDYENWNDIKKIDNSLGENAIIKVEVIDNYYCFESNSGKKIYKVPCKEANNEENLVDLIFFNNFFTPAKMKKGKQFLVKGEIKPGYKDNYEVICPKVKGLDEISTSLEPVYPQVKGLSYLKIRKFVSESMKLLPKKICETIPEKFLKKYELPSLEFAIKNIHFPNSEENLKISRKRIDFEELLNWILSVRKIKHSYDSKFKIDNYLKDFLKLLKFKLTSSQIKNINSCLEDMARGKSMMRLLQGDVGSGKTIVAMALAHSVVKSRFQVAMMVPTEVLAIQHYDSFVKILGSDNVYVITGSTNKRDRERATSRFMVGIPGVLIGTHALISDSIEFKNLALVITDEQHKFGVNQRLKLAKKGDNPHNLVMSATPIPRSLAMILHGDMDLCVIDEMPKGRKQVETVIIQKSERKKGFDIIKSELCKGHQAYIVCSKVGESENKDEVDVENYQKNVIKGYFDGFEIGILHGKMRSYEKEKAIEKFASGETKLLIATTVIEVGIDVSNATVIMIENSERFGLASLHQMRGRVGRGDKKSYCILVQSKGSETSLLRLKTMRDSNNGFYLAEKDLSMRGPGDFFGTQQHGKLSENLVKSLKNPVLISQVTEFSDFILRTGFKFRSIRPSPR